jgi:membrane protein DedA with SNARE-associated domain
MSDMPYGPFLLFDTCALALWTVGVVSLGYFLNAQVQLVDEILSRFGWGLLILIVLYIGGKAAWKRRDAITKWFRSKKPSSARS